MDGVEKERRCVGGRQTHLLSAHYPFWHVYVSTFTHCDFSESKVTFLPVTHWSDCCCQLQMISPRWKLFKVRTVTRAHALHVESAFCPHDTAAHCSHQAKRFVIHLAYIPFSCPPLLVYTSPCLPCHPHAVTRAAVICCSQQHGLRNDFLASKGRTPHPKALSSEYWTQRLEYGEYFIFDYVSLFFVCFCRCGGWWWRQTTAAHIWMRSHSNVPVCVCFFHFSGHSIFIIPLVAWCFTFYSSQKILF